MHALFWFWVFAVVCALSSGRWGRPLPDGRGCCAHDLGRGFSAGFGVGVRIGGEVGEGCGCGIGVASGEGVRTLGVEAFGSGDCFADVRAAQRPLELGVGEVELGADRVEVGMRIQIEGEEGGLGVRECRRFCGLCIGHGWDFAPAAERGKGGFCCCVKVAHGVVTLRFFYVYVVIADSLDVLWRMFNDDPPSLCCRVSFLPCGCVRE